MDSQTEKILAFIEERIEWNVDMMKRDPKPSDIGRIEEAKCIRRFIESLQEEPVSEDLEEAAIDAADNDMQGRQIMEASNEDRMLYSRIFRRGFKAGANWQKAKDQETIELAEDHAMLAGMEKMREKMINAAIEWTRRNANIHDFRWASVFREAMNKVK